uniref:DNA-directed RNA polymerase II subunit RPB1-like n=1 Tax=Callithrix jacchus TaxID=9483 RepID=UPI0023DD15EC|nr:DNA-directed RNA polymerase II subunit RPB1-like [Callithrix jacchus]
MGCSVLKPRQSQENLDGRHLTWHRKLPCPRPAPLEVATQPPSSTGCTPPAQPGPAPCCPCTHTATTAPGSDLELPSLLWAPVPAFDSSGGGSRCSRVPCGSCTVAEALVLPPGPRPGWGLQPGEAGSGQTQPPLSSHQGRDLEHPCTLPTSGATSSRNISPGWWHHKAPGAWNWPPGAGISRPPRAASSGTKPSLGARSPRAWESSSFGTKRGRGTTRDRDKETRASQGPLNGHQTDAPDSAPFRPSHASHKTHSQNAGQPSVSVAPDSAAQCDCPTCRVCPLSHLSKRPCSMQHTPTSSPQAGSLLRAPPSSAPPLHSCRP